MYEIARTIEDIVRGGYMRITLQVPNELLSDSGRVYGLIPRGLNSSRARAVTAEPGHDGGDGGCGGEKAAANYCQPSITTAPSPPCRQSFAATPPLPAATAAAERKVFILADAYAAFCVDEIAAERVCADVLVHCGRACLSPTTRLPVVYVFATSPLAVPPTVAAFRATLPALDAKVRWPTPPTPPTCARCTPPWPHSDTPACSPPPPCTIPPRCCPTARCRPMWLAAAAAALREYDLFPMCEPQPSLQLILASRVAAIHC